MAFIFLRVRANIGGFGVDGDEFMPIGTYAIYFSGSANLPIFPCWDQIQISNASMSEKCTKCGSTDVWLTLQKGYDNRWLWISMFSNAQIERYCCLKCGLIEERISKEDLQNAEKMARIRKNFTQG
jgi:hypothetical protein